MTPSSEQQQYLRIAMTLAALAYADTETLRTQLDDPTLATQGKWKIAWGPCKLGSNLVYVVEHHDNGEYAVAIRGTILRVESIFEDADSLKLVALPWNDETDVTLSAGMALGWSNISAMKDPSSGQTLAAFVGGLPSGVKLYLTGHSQGGCLASVVAYWLYDLFHTDHTIVPYTFAGETAGPQSFAHQYDDRFSTGDENRGIRAYNEIDIVARAFWDLGGIRSLYSPEPPYVDCSDEFRATIDALVAFLDLIGDHYVQPGGGYELSGTPVECNGVDIWTRPKIWFDQIAVQHSHYTYLQLLGAPLTADAPSPWPPKSLPD